MSNIRRRNEPALYDPWRDFFDIDSFFPTGLARRSMSSLPAVNISEDNQCYCIDVVAPGFKKDDFKLNVEDDMLTISAEAKSETTDQDNNKQYSRREYSHSSFTRSFRLPENVKDEEISAEFSDGILKLNIPKREPKAKTSKEIPIS